MTGRPTVAARRNTIRRARPEDAAGIRKAHVASIRKLCRSHYSDGQIAAWTGGVRASYYRSAILDGRPVYVAVVEGRVVALSELDGDQIRAVYVRAKYAGRGLGTQLLDAVERAARARSLHRVWLDSTLNAVPFYRAHGYRRRGRQRHRLASGAIMQSVRMEKELR